MGRIFSRQESFGWKSCPHRVTKNKMPPKKYLKDNPEAKLSDEEKKIICSWAATLKADK